MKKTIQLDIMLKHRRTIDDNEDAKKDEIEGKLKQTDPQMQDFLRKVTRIIALLLKD